METNNQLKSLTAFLIIFITGFILGLILFNKCDGTNNTVTITKVKHTTDTIWAKDTLYSFKNIIIPKRIIDTIYKPIYIDSGICNTVSLYTDSLIDSNIVINYKDYVQGVMRNKEITYKLKVPLKIIDSIVVDKTQIIKPTKGLSTSLIATNRMIAPGIAIRHKNNEFGINLGISSPINNPSLGLMLQWKHILIEK